MYLYYIILNQQYREGLDATSYNVVRREPKGVCDYPHGRLQYCCACRFRAVFVLSPRPKTSSMNYKKTPHTTPRLLSTCEQRQIILLVPPNAVARRARASIANSRAQRSL